MDLKIAWNIITKYSIQNKQKEMRKHTIQYWRIAILSVKIALYDKSEEGDSTSIMNAWASPGRWKPGVSKIRRKITPKLQAEQSKLCRYPPLTG